jgi:hypothetical protein
MRYFHAALFGLIALGFVWNASTAAAEEEPSGIAVERRPALS